MAKIISVLIELNYDYDTLSESVDEDITVVDFLDKFEDTVYQELTDLMRGDRLPTWATITLKQEGN